MPLKKHCTSESLHVVVRFSRIHCPISCGFFLFFVFVQFGALFSIACGIKFLLFVGRLDFFMSKSCLLYFGKDYAHSRRRRGVRGGGRPSIWFKTSKIRANSLFIWPNSPYIWAHHWQKTVSVSVKTFFFSFGEHLKLDRKTVQISVKTFFFGEHLNLGRKNRLNFDRETQCIKSFFGQKFGAPQIILSS